MAEIKQTGNEITVKFNTEKMSPGQARLIKSLNSMLAHVISTEDEAEFFESSAELMRMCAAVMKQARFTETLIHMDNIPYAEQVLEYSLEMLQENISISKVVNYDC